MCCLNGSSGGGKNKFGGGSDIESPIIKFVSISCDSLSGLNNSSYSSSISSLMDDVVAGEKFELKESII